MAKSKTKNNKALLVFLVVVLIAVVGVAVFFLTRPKQEAESVMALSVNPGVQFVLDQNNKVMRVNATSEAGQALMAEVEFVGKDANEAARLFVKIATEAGYIEADTTGKEVTITITCDDETSQKFTELKESVKTSVNNYFKEVGVKARALVSVGEDLINDAEKLGIEAAELAGKTFEEILEVVDTRAIELKDIALSYRNEFMTRIETLKTQFSTMFDKEELIADLKAQLENSMLPNEAKELLKTQLEAAEKTYNELKLQFDQKVDKIIEELEKLSEDVIKTLKENLETALQTGRELLEQHIEEFNRNKETILPGIELYQNEVA